MNDHAPFQCAVSGERFRTGLGHEVRVPVHDSIFENTHARESRWRGRDGNKEGGELVREGYHRRCETVSDKLRNIGMFNLVVSVTVPGSAQLAIGEVVSSFFFGSKIRKLEN